MKYTGLKNYEEFKEYEVPADSMASKELDGKFYKFEFPNGYGASVIKCYFSYGNQFDLFELAVLKKVRNGWVCCYDTPITADDFSTLGNLDNEGVIDNLRKIMEL